MTYVPEQKVQQSAFGDSLTGFIKPIAAIKATYGVLTNAETFTATGGSVTAASGNFVLTTGTSVGGYGTVWTRQPIVYQPGIGVEARGTAAFTTGVTLSTQGWGLFSSADGMIVGYDGSTFGCMHRRGGEFEIRTLTVTAGSGGAATVTVTLNGTAYTASITSGTTVQNAHEIEVGLNAGAAANSWYIQHVDSTVVFMFKGIGAKSGTYSVSVSAGTFAGSIAQTNAGATPTETWYPRASWNRDTCSWLDPTKANLYKMEFAYLGYGPLNYYVRNPTTDQWVLYHQVDWGNANTTPNFGSPSMRTGWFSASLGSTTNLTVRGANCATYLQGDRFDGRAFGATGTSTGVTTETQVLTIQVRREFGGKACNCVIVPTVATLSTDSTKGATFKFYRNPTVSGTTAHTYVSQTDSIALSDTAGTTVSGGRLLAVVSVGPTGRTTVDLDRINMLLVSGDELVVTAAVVSGAAADMSCSITWEEIV